MKPTDVAQALTALIPTRRPVYLWGSPGVGKSSIIRQAAQQGGLALIDIRAVLLDPVDLRGLPRIENGNAQWCPPDFLPKQGSGVLFLDELAQAPPLVQAACAAPGEILLGDNLPIEKISVGATVLGKSGQIQRVSQKFSRPYDGDMIRVKARMCLPFSVTPDHPIAVCGRKLGNEDGVRKYVYGQPRWIPAGDLKPGDCVFVPKLQGQLVTSWVLFGDYIQSVQSKTPQQIRDGVPLTEELAELFGYYLAEGCHSVGGGDHVQLAFHKDETDLVERAVDLVRRLLGHESRVEPMKDCNGVTVRFGGCILAKFFADHFGANSRELRIPDFLFYHSNERLLRAMLTAYWKGDGWHKPSASRLHMVTASRMLAMQLQLLCGRLGVLVSVQKRRVSPSTIRGRKTRGGTAYVLTSTMPEAMAWVGLSKLSGLKRPTRHYGEVEGAYVVPVKSVERAPYQGPVYDVTTEDHSLILSNVVTHNCLQLTLDRRIGEYRLPDGWSVIAASNRQEDRAGAHRLISPLLNRFVHIDLEVSHDDWQEWAVKEGIGAEVRSFLRYRPGLLFQFDPTSNQRSFPTPRSWEFVSQVLPNLSEELTLPVVAGCVGEGPAAEFVGFARMYKELPDLDQVLAQPTTTAVPKEPAVLYALVGALVEKCRKGTQALLTAFVNYATRLPDEFGVLAMRDALAINQKLIALPQAQAWLTKARQKGLFA